MLVKWLLLLLEQQMTLGLQLILQDTLFFGFCFRFQSFVPFLGKLQFSTQFHDLGGDFLLLQQTSFLICL